MANDIGGKTWAIDTTGTIRTGWWGCKSMTWAPAAASDTLAVTDKNSVNIIPDQTALAATNVGDVTFDLDSRYNGLIVTISAGTLFVTIT